MLAFSCEWITYEGCVTASGGDRVHQLTHGDNFFAGQIDRLLLTVWERKHGTG